MAPHRTVLLVEGEPTLLDSLGFTLRRRGYHVLATTDGRRAAEWLDREKPDAVVVGMLLPGLSGFELVRLAKECRGTPVVMTAPSAAAHADYALALGVDRFLVRPFTPDDVGAVVEAVCPPPPNPNRAAGTGAVPRHQPANARDRVDSAGCG